MPTEVPCPVKPEKRKPFFGPLYRACRAIVRATHKRQPVLGFDNVKDLPAVFISRHQDLYGPVEIMAWVPMNFRVWTLYKFMDARECKRHYAQYTFSERKGLGKFAARGIAAILAPFVTALMHSMRGIPVFRGQKNIMDTFRESVRALSDGENLLIMPERDYLDDGSDAGEFYSGFVHIAQLYGRATGKKLSFYPIYPNRTNGTIYIERPVSFDPAKPFRAERERVIEALRRELNHTVVEQDFETQPESGQ